MSLDIALGNAKAGMEAAMHRVAVTNDNIANAGTAGYRQKVPVFSTMMTYDMERVGSLTATDGTTAPTGIQIGLGVKLSGISRIQKPGAPTQTENPYHVMIQGNGYFQITLPNGETAYTRAGTFEVNQEGVLVDLDGNEVQPGIQVPAGTVRVTISPQGEVFAKQDGQVADVNLGQISLASFQNPNGLEAIDGNLLMETPASGPPVVGNPDDAGFGRLLQGWFENSNVNSVTSITDLIEGQRTFELNTKAARSVDEMKAQLKSILS